MMARFLGAASAIVEVDRIDFFWVGAGWSGR